MSVVQIAITPPEAFKLVGRDTYLCDSSPSLLTSQEMRVRHVLVQSWMSKSLRMHCCTRELRYTGFHVSLCPSQHGLTSRLRI